MPRVAMAVVICGAGLCLLSGTPVSSAPSTPAVPVTRAWQAELQTDKSSSALLAEANNNSGGAVRVASHEQADSVAGPASGNADAKAGGDADETANRAPARQVPVAPGESPSGENEIESAEPVNSKSVNGAGEKPDDDGASESEQVSHGSAAKTPASSTKKDVDAAGSSGTNPDMHPGLPIRKPPKPIIKPRRVGGKSAKKSSLPRSEREKKLCRALQTCRNSFRKCKGKIKYPDQSDAWIIAKEECGAVYKTCVEKDFQGGEWFLTRWFYFGELQCK